MKRICLVSMPFGGLAMPSLGLTQLREVLLKRFGEELEVEVLYLNHDFASHLGLDNYWLVSEDIDVYHTGFGDWFFRQVAFPMLPDNTEEYFARYYPRRSPTRDALRWLCEERRADLETYFERLIREYSLDQADVVGFTSMFHQTVACLAMARKLKQANAEVVTLLGGANCRLPMGRVLAERSEQIDYVFTSLALRALPELIEALRAGRLPPVQIPNVLQAGGNARDAMPPRPRTDIVLTRGLVRSKRQYLDADKVATADVPQLVAGAEPPIELDYGGFLTSFRRKVNSTRINPTLMVETSRGCWWGQVHHCTFCGIDDAEMQYHEMRPDRALAQFESLLSRYPDVKRIMAVDYILSRNHLKTMVPRLNPPSDVCIYYDMKANMTAAEVESLSRAGIKVIQPGIESIATSTLKAMRKGVDAFQNIRLLINCSMYDVFPDWNLLLGVPGQTDDSYPKYCADIPHLRHLPPPAGAFPIRFDRYSPYFSSPAEWELELAPMDFYGFTYPYNADELADLAYHHVNTNGNAGYYAGLCDWYLVVADAVRTWQSRWKGTDGKVPAALYIAEASGTHVVCDSRSGDISEFVLDRDALELLQFLSTPKHLDAVIAVNDNARVHIDTFRQRGWLFEEEGRLLSLVLPSRPPAPSYPNGFFAMEAP